jgi:hypothetical protein
MTTLRWLLGSVIALIGAGTIALFVLGDGFRRSFGASANSLFMLLLPLAGGALMLAALIAPGHRWLLHLAAIAAVALAGGCLWQIFTEAATVLWLVLALLALWFVFYSMALRVQG